MKLRFGFVIALIAALTVTGVALVADAAQKRVIYFTAHEVPTTAEKAVLATLNAQTVAPLKVLVRSADQARTRGTHREVADFVVGAIPPNYRDGGIDSGTSLYPVLNTTGTTLLIKGGGSVTLIAGKTTAVVSAYTPPDGGT